MKAKVTYTVDYEDVPKIVNKLVNECRDRLKNLSNFKFDFFRLEHAAQEIQKIRGDLDLISEQLEDCLNLCNGYVEASPDIADKFDVNEYMTRLADLESQLSAATPSEVLDEE